ncbi:thioredoxin domain-containing protein [Phytoactinopolyspora limicola]|uniref:thioredoxin domain-containing protein n=1 Tax=Phytoactinopolyspora limicola TaxID=2715536 RepID=UPI00140AB9D8
MEGVVVVAAVLVVATIFGLWHRRRDGAVRTMGDGGDERPALVGADLGVELGARATLVQFSSAFCQPCRAVRGRLAHVADQVDGVRHVEIDAERNLDLVRRLGIVKTPTTLVLDGAGRIVARASGVPSLDDVHAALPAT